MAGDLGNLEVAEDGSCSVHIEDRREAHHPHSIIGRSSSSSAARTTSARAATSLAVDGQPGPARRGRRRGHRAVLGVALRAVFF